MAEPGGTKKAETAAWYGVLTALAMILGYVETLLPLSIGIPGVKPGLANLVTFVALYRMRAVDAFAISIARILLTGFTFGSGFSLLYSLAGGLVSFAVMYFCRKKDWFEKTGVSIAGGVAHNLGQLAVAALVLESAAVLTYLPALIFFGVAMGALIGFLGALLLKRLPEKLR